MQASENQATSKLNTKKRELEANEQQAKGTMKAGCLQARNKMQAS